MISVSLSTAFDIISRSMSKNGKVPRHHRTAVRSFIDLHGDILIEQVTAQQVIDWYAHIRKISHEDHADQKLSAWTVDNYARMLKAFFSNAVRLGYIEVSPAATLGLPKLPKKKKKEMTERDIDLLIAHSKWLPRDHALILITRDTGCRVGGMQSMRLSDVQITEESDGKFSGRIIVYEKMNKARMVYFGDQACVALKTYIESRPLEACDALWLNNQGQPLRSSGLYQIFERTAKKANVTRFNPHAFRHALAKRLADAGTPIKAIADLLGHEDPGTTMRMYITYDEDDLARLYRQFARR